MEMSEHVRRLRLKRSHGVLNLDSGIYRRRMFGEGYLKGLVIMVHLISGGSFAVAAAFTSKIILLTTFWHGIVLGGLMYGLIIIVIGNG